LLVFVGYYSLRRRKNPRAVLRGDFELGKLQPSDFGPIREERRAAQINRD
jgi:hypothetical protein